MRELIAGGNRDPGELVKAVDVLASDHKRPDIQGLRAIAVLMVVAFHAGLPVPGGFVGVDVFFVISGFVITRMLHREWRTTGRVNFGRFYLRRFKRLFPALALMVAVTMLISVAVLSPLGIQQTAAQTGIGAILIVANVVIARTTGGYFDADAHTNPFLHTWSLSVEEQFYLLFPAVIAFGWSLATRHRKVRGSPYLVVGVIAAVSLGCACFGSLVGTELGKVQLLGRYGLWLEQLLGFYSPVTRTWEFAFGVLLALVAGRLGVLARGGAPVLGVLGAILLAGSVFVISGTTPFPGVWTLLPVTGTLLLLAAGTVDGNLLTRALSVGPMVKIGDWSYSIYLWHWPFIVFAEWLWPGSGSALLAAAVLSLVPAVASYQWLEMPIRNMPAMPGRRVVRVVAATLITPLLVCILALVAVEQGYWAQGIRSMQATRQPHEIDFCSPDIDREGYFRPCIFNSGSKGRPIYLVGDSTAWHFTEAAIGAGELLGRPVSVLPLPLCQFKDVFSKAERGDSAVVAAKLNVGIVNSCRGNYEKAMGWLLKAPTGTVIISNLNQEYQGSAIEFGLSPNALTRNPSRRVEVLNAGLASTIETLERDGHTVLVVQAAPSFRGGAHFDPLRCTWNQLRKNECVARMSRSEADSIQRTQRSSLQAVTVQTGAGIWDPRDFFCPGGECSTQVHGINLYRDETHISPRASQLLAISLADALKQLPTSPTK